MSKPDVEKKFTVLGGGSWGTTLASLLCRAGSCCLWARNPKTVQDINRTGFNSRYLGDIALNPDLNATWDLREALASTQAVFVAIPSQHFRSVMVIASPFITSQVPIISLTKGLEEGTGLRMTEILSQLLPRNPVGVLTGPNLAKEILAGKAAASVIAMNQPRGAERLQAKLNSGLFRVYTNNDVIGCELGGVLKNIIAIAVGMGDGLGAGDNTRAALITRGLAEVTRLGVAMGGHRATFAGLAGMGDMIATCTSSQSRNRHVGLELAKGLPIDAIIESMHMVAEGVKNTSIVVEVAQNAGIDVPICEEVLRAIMGNRGPRSVYRGLLSVMAGAESEPG